MKPSKAAVISSLIILATIVVLIVFRSVPVTRIWNGYSVLYVERSESESSVMYVLSQCGVQNVISLGVQKTPFASDFVPSVYPKDSVYISSRNGYFFDESRKYALYYIPERYEAQLSKALNILTKDMNLSAGLDGRQKALWVVPLIVTVFFAFLCWFSSSRIAFACPAVFFLFLSYSLPFLPVCAASCIFMTACYFASRLWGRRGFIKTVLQSVYLDGMLASSVLILILFSWRSLITGVFACAASVSSLVLYSEVQKYLDSKSAFSFVPVFKANQILVVCKNNARFFLYAAASVFLCTLLFFASTRFAPVSKAGKLSLPSPVEKNSAHKLPSLSDCYVFAWNVLSMPYRSLNTSAYSVPEENEKIIVEHYEASRNGISVSQSEAMCYDEKFRSSVDQEIDSLSYPAIEKLIKKQGRNVCVSYSMQGGTKTNSSVLSMLLLIFGVCVPLTMYAYYYLFGRGRYENRK